MGSSSSQLWHQHHCSYLVSSRTTLVLFVADDFSCWRLDVGGVALVVVVVGEESEVASSTGAGIIVLVLRHQHGGV
jgi:hypothetical protein